jgi:acyl-CoA synthetase (AMP-forming)/AMP-acid ligase II
MFNYTTLTAALKDNARDDRSVTFIEGINSETVVSYRDLYRRALELLHYFQSLGLKPGDELIFFLKDNAGFVEAFWACLLGGIVPVPIAIGISDEHRSKLMRIFQRLKHPYLLIDRKASELLKAYAESENLNVQYEAIQQHTLLLEDIALNGQPGQEHTPEADDLAFIQFSSGSTREPKGVPLTHRNLLTTIVDMGQRAAYTSDDISLSWMPLTHDLGLIGFHLTMIIFAMNQNIMATEVFSRRPLLWLQKTSEKRATLLSSPNFGYKHYLKLYNSRDDRNLDLSPVRMIMNGAEPISVGLCNEFLDTLAKHGLRRSAMYPGYGLAEASLGVCLPIPGNEFESVIVDRDSLVLGGKVVYTDASHVNALRFAIEGPPVARCGLRIADLDGNDLGQNSVGEIQIKGPNVTAGYYNDADANRDLFTNDGWLRTGDLGFLHGGQLVVTGRLKDIIFANGLNYYPHDLEAIALKSDKLELGKVVAVGARGNDTDHDDILVCVLYRGDLEDFLLIAREVRMFINEQTGLEITHVLPVQRIPKTTSGKIQRRFFADDYLRGEFAAVIDELARLQSRQATNVAADSANESEYIHKLQFICDSLLPGRHIGAQDNFFEIGLSSLDLAQISEKINEYYPDTIDITDLFDHPTLESLANLIDFKSVHHGDKT